MYFNKEEIIKEAQNRAVIRARGLNLDDTQIPDGDLDEYLKTAADEVFIKIQTLTDRYDYDDKIYYYLKDPDNKVIPIMYTLIKNYLTEGILKGWYEDSGYTDGALLSQHKQEKQMEKLQQYRIRPTNRVYNGL